jgi:hypothetical protein
LEHTSDIFAGMITQDRLMEKINALPPRKLSEVEDFVDFISAKTNSAERDDLIAQFAAEFGGTEFDLDEDLEAADIEVLATMDEKAK